MNAPEKLDHFIAISQTPVFFGLGSRCACFARLIAVVVGLLCLLATAPGRTLGLAQTVSHDQISVTSRIYQLPATWRAKRPSNCFVGRCLFGAARLYTALDVHTACYMYRND